MQEFLVRKGTHAGRGHLLSFKNRQDAHSVFDGTINGERTIIGVICDGCSEGTASETGATLAATFLIREIHWSLQCGLKPSEIPPELYPRLRDFLGRLLRLYEFSSTSDRVAFIKDHLLFTVVGFVVTESEVCLFITGDGILVINDEILPMFANDQALYPAYHLIDRSLLEPGAAELPTSFDVYSPDRASLSRIAIGSDAWIPEQNLLSEFWGFKNPAGVQRRLNQLSKAERRFHDDVTIITVEIVESAQTEEESQ